MTEVLYWKGDVPPGMVVIPPGGPAPDGVRGDWGVVSAKSTVGREHGMVPVGHDAQRGVAYARPGGEGPAVRRQRPVRGQP